MDASIIVSRDDDAPQHHAFEDSLIQAAYEAGASVLVTSHLYHIPEDSETWRSVATLRGRVLLFTWLHARPMEWLARRHALAADELQVFDLSSFASPDAALDAVREYIDSSTGGTIEDVIDSTESRWYPIIDYSRCTSCGHCLQFCIFGTYELDAAGRVNAVYPDNCKPGCPACARICPNSAIMFALHPDDPAISGAPGCLVTLDAAARKMYYLRTGAECPRCGLSGPWQSHDEPACTECGRPLIVSSQESASTDDLSNSSDTLDEIDALIDELDRVAGGGD